MHIRTYAYSKKTYTYAFSMMYDAKTQTTASTNGPVCKCVCQQTRALKPRNDLKISFVV